jgi:hypothetical protein
MLMVRLLTGWFGLVALSMFCVGDDGCGEAVEGARQAEKRELDSTCDYVCPNDYWGQWNGVHYYGGQYCYGCMDGGYYSATSNDLHDLGSDCNKDNCLTPIEYVRGPFEFGRGIDQTELSEIEDYVGPKKAGGPPGSGDDSRSKFDPVICDVLEEWIVLLRTNRGRRYFRVLQLKHISRTPPDGIMYVGQELNKDDDWTHTKTAQLREVSIRDPRRAELQMEVDGGSTVIVKVIAKMGLRKKVRP